MMTFFVTFACKCSFLVTICYSFIPAILSLRILPIPRHSLQFNYLPFLIPFSELNPIMVFITFSNSWHVIKPDLRLPSDFMSFAAPLFFFVFSYWQCVFLVYWFWCCRYWSLFTGILLYFLLQFFCNGFHVISSAIVFQYIFIFILMASHFFFLHFGLNTFFLQICQIHAQCGYTAIMVFFSLFCDKFPHYYCPLITFCYIVLIVFVLWHHTRKDIRSPSKQMTWHPSQHAQLLLPSMQLSTKKSIL